MGVRALLGRGALAVGIATALALLRITPQTWWAESSFTAAAVIFFFRETEWAPRVVAGVLGLGLAAAYAVAHPESQSWATTLAYGVGTASSCVAAGRAIVSKPDEFAARFRSALVVSLFLISLYADVPVLVTMTARTPLTFDSILTAADQSLAGNMSFAVGRFLRAHTLLRSSSRVAYYGMPVWVMLAAGLRWRRYGAADETSIPVAVAIGAVLAPVFYSVVPAAGPAFRWATRFPFDPPATGEVALTTSPLGMSGVPNAMPSLHFAYALLVLWGSWSLGITGRSFGIVFAVLTALATLGLGEHYVVDLVVAVPFTMMLVAAAGRSAGWERSVGLAATLTLAWLCAIRFLPGVWANPAFVRSAVIATLGLCAAVWRLHTHNARPSMVDEAITAAPASSVE